MGRPKGENKVFVTSRDWKIKDFDHFIKEYAEYFNNERPAYCINYKTPILNRTPNLRQR